MLDFSSNVTSKRNEDRSDVSGIGIKFVFLALLDPNLQTNTRSVTPFSISRSSGHGFSYVKGVVCRIQIKSKTPFTSKCYGREGHRTEPGVWR